MKKWAKWIALLVMLLVIPSLLPDCSCAYGSDELVYENMHFTPHSFALRCFADMVTWPEGQTEMILRIPDRVDGKRVTALGGFIGSGGPSPFAVNIPDLEGYCLEDCLPEDAVVEQYHLTIILGKYVQEASLVDMNYCFDMGGNRYIQILVTADPGENPYFAVKDGRLYRKVDGETVQGFFYASDYETN